MMLLFCACFILVLQLSVGALASPTASTSPQYVSLTSNVKVIMSALTRDLEVTCTFPPIAKVGISEIVTMVVSKRVSDDKDEDIAKMSVFQPTVVNKFVDVGAEITGKLDPAGTSFLKFKWLYPEPNNAGIYVCQVNALRQSGHSEIFETTLRITNTPPDLTTLIGQVRFNSRRQDGVISNLTRLQQMNARRVKVIVENLFDISTVTNGIQYLVSRMDFQDVNIAETLCGLADGHLADIKDANERLAVKTFIQTLPKHSSRFTYTLFSPTDEDHEGTWVFRHSGEAVNKKITWASGQPASSSTSNCAVFRTSNLQSYANRCYGLANYNFICQRQVSP